MESGSGSGSESEFSPKRQRSPTYGQVCVVIHRWSKPDEYQLYIVDCDSSSGGDYRYMEPTFRYKGKRLPVAFCALEQKIYMFEGADPDRYREGKRKSAWKYEMPQDGGLVGNKTTWLQREKNLVRIKSMDHHKFSPKALPTPDGKKILVFSSLILWHNFQYPGGTFELYDVGENSWTPAQALPARRLGPLCCHFIVESYGFQDESHFVIQMKGGSFALNLQTLEWEESIGCRIHEASSDYFFGVGHFHFTPRFAYHITDFRQFQFPHLSSFPHDADARKDPMYTVTLHMLPPCITPLGKSKDGIYNMCVVRTRRYPYRRKKTKNLRVVLDIFRTDLEKFKKEVEDAAFNEDGGDEDMMSIDNEDEDDEEKDEKQEPKAEEDPVIYTNTNPLSNSTTLEKTIKLVVDFNFSDGFSGQMHVFSI